MLLYSCIVRIVVSAESSEEIDFFLFSVFCTSFLSIRREFSFRRRILCGPGFRGNRREKEIFERTISRFYVSSNELLIESKCSVVRVSNQKNFVRGAPRRVYVDKQSLLHTQSTKASRLRKLILLFPERDERVECV